MRILSICLPLKSGREYLDLVFSNWEPLKDFYAEKRPFYLLKDYFYDGKEEFLHNEIPINPLDF